jgi:hypothetical protein
VSSASPGDEVIRYANILRALKECFEAEKHDRDAYANFGEAMDVAMERARAAARAFVLVEVGKVRERRKGTLERRRARVASVFAEGLAARTLGTPLTEAEICQAAEAYAAAKVRE